MAKETIEISLTDFIGFVNKVGTAKLNHVKAIKHRDDYQPYKDYYKPIRTAIQNLHKKSQNKSVLDNVIDGVEEIKKNNFRAVINGYKRFLGRKKFEWIKPPKKNWTMGDISITVNPEIGLEEMKKDGTSDFYIVKLYFKEDKIQKSHVDQILTLMEMQLRSKVGGPEVKFALLDVRKGKLHAKKDHELTELPLLEGEAKSFATIWGKL